MLFILGAFLFGDVAEAHREDARAADGKSRDRRISGKFFAVAAQPVKRRAAFSHVSGGETFQMPLVRSAKPLGDEHVERFADHLGARAAKYVFCAFVEKNDAPVRVDRNNRISGNRYDSREFRFGES
jgi:hypothetical protein